MDSALSIFSRAVEMEFPKYAVARSRVGVACWNTDDGFLTELMKLLNEVWSPRASCSIWLRALLAPPSVAVCEIWRLRVLRKELKLVAKF